MTEETPDNSNQADIFSTGQFLTLESSKMYENLLEKLGNSLTDQFLKDASQEDKESFVRRLKETQLDKFEERLALMMNRILTDHHFIKAYEDIMSPYKPIVELRQDNEIANNHLQSVENERSILQRDTDMAIDRLEILCEAILEHKLVQINPQSEQ